MSAAAKVIPSRYDSSPLPAPKQPCGSGVVGAADYAQSGQLSFPEDGGVSSTGRLLRRTTSSDETAFLGQTMSDDEGASRGQSLTKYPAASSHRQRHERKPVVKPHVSQYRIQEPDPKMVASTKQHMGERLAQLTANPFSAGSFDLLNASRQSMRTVGGGGPRPIPYTEVSSKALYDRMDAAQATSIAKNSQMAERNHLQEEEDLARDWLIRQYLDQQAYLLKPRHEYDVAVRTFLKVVQDEKERRLRDEEGVSNSTPYRSAFGEEDREEEERQRIVPPSVPYGMASLAPRAEKTVLKLIEEQMCSLEL